MKFHHLCVRGAGEECVLVLGLCRAPAFAMAIAQDSRLLRPLAEPALRGERLADLIVSSG